MPHLKRKRQCSGRSSISNKSPRKSNLNASAAGEVVEDEEDQPFVDKISLNIEEEEWTLNYCEELACLSSGEESENENKIPKEKDQISHCLHINSSCSSPVKRASPLSPTLFDNVLHQQSLITVPPSLESNNDIILTPSHDPKVEEASQSLVLNATRRSKRHVFNGSISDITLSTENKTNTVAKSQSNKEDVQNKETTSQKQSDETNEKVELPVAVFRIIDYQIDEAPPEDPDNYRKQTMRTKQELCQDVLYELDEVDITWLEIVNEKRTNRPDGLNLGKVELEEMELLMDRLEKENYFELHNAGMGEPGESDEDAVCCICLDGESDNSNLIIFCDMCNIPVHQDCFGVPFIPEGSWLCRRCTVSPNGTVECIFCPNTDGAFKETIDGRWSHVLCALWIPEVRFANPSLVDLVDDIDDIPTARWKLTCFLCKKKGVGACIQCHLRSCVTAFHATCAQAAGLSLKLETKESSGVRLRASCDKHTSAGELVTLKQKIETINKVLNEKCAAPPEAQFPSVPSERIAAIFELVQFPGKFQFMKRLLAYWKLKRKSRGGAPLIRGLESLWSPSMKVPPAPPTLERKFDPELTESCFGKMKELKNALTGIKGYFECIKDHSEKQREDRLLAFKIQTMQMDAFRVHGIDVFIDILNKLQVKDKHETFAEPVSCDDAPDYFTVILNPMDLSTMRQKAIELNYPTIDDLEADFELMINNCMTYNKKSTPFYKDAVKLKEYGNHVFQEARCTLEQRSLNQDTDALKITDSKEQNCHHHALQGVLIRIVEQLAGHDKNGIFAEPIDVEELPDYLTIIQNPMDFSTMRNKINTNQYSSIEELEVDYILMITNCLTYNEEDSEYYKAAKKLQELGRSVFTEAKKNHYMPELPAPLICTALLTENNNIYKTDETSDGSLFEPVKVVKSLTKEDIFDIMSDVLNKLIKSDDEEIFLEPVSDEDAPGYSDIIKSPMDFSLMEKNLKSSVYSSIEDMEKDFVLMIHNCKRYNSHGTMYHNYATKVRRAGNVIFNAARKLIASYKTTTEDEEQKL